MQHTTLMTPAFHCFPLAGGGLHIMKLTSIVEVPASDASKWADAAKRFEINRTMYSLLDGGKTRIVGGLIREFAKDTFHHTSVVQWAAFVRIDMTDREVSSALAELRKEAGPPVEKLSPRGPGTEWAINRSALEKYLHV